MRFLLAAVAAALLASSVGCQSMRSGCGSGCGSAPACCGGDECYEGCGCGDDCCSNGFCGNGGCGNGACGCGPFAGDPSTCPCGPGDSVYDFTPGPPGGQVAYPYYTTRGPRDFLDPNPMSPGPSGAYGCR